MDIESLEKLGNAPDRCMFSTAGIERIAAALDQLDVIFKSPTFTHAEYRLAESLFNVHPAHARLCISKLRALLEV